MFEFNLQNLHHAYIIEGDRNKNLSALLNALENTGIRSLNNPDFFTLVFDSFKMDDARFIKSNETQKSFSGGKKIFIISAGGFLLEAQNALLKSLEEPKQDTHFFILTDKASILIDTFLSRCFLIQNNHKENKYAKKAEDFLNMSMQDRLDLIKELLMEKSDTGEDEESDQKEKGKTGRFEALKFLDALELVLYKSNMSRIYIDRGIFEHLFKVREFLRESGSAPKMLLESIALLVP